MAIKKIAIIGTAGAGVYSMNVCAKAQSELIVVLKPRQVGPSYERKRVDLITPQVIKEFYPNEVSKRTSSAIWKKGGRKQKNRYPNTRR